MKDNKILSSLYYTFIPNLKQIKFADNLGIKHEDILMIINLSANNQMIFNFGSAPTGGTYSNSILTLVYNTTLMNPLDKLMIVVREENKVEKYLQKLLIETKNSNDMLETFFGVSTENNGILNYIIDSLKPKTIPTILYTHITTNTTTLCKAGKGTFHKLIFNNPTDEVITIYDSLTAAGEIIAIIDNAAGADPYSLTYDINFSVGLTILTLGSPDLTVTFN